MRLLLALALATVRSAAHSWRGICLRCPPSFAGLCGGHGAGGTACVRALRAAQRHAVLGQCRRRQSAARRPCCAQTCGACPLAARVRGAPRPSLQTTAPRRLRTTTLARHLHLRTTTAAQLPVRTPCAGVWHTYCMLPPTLADDNTTNPPAGACGAGARWRGCRSPRQSTSWAPRMHRGRHRRHDGNDAHQQHCHWG